MRRPPGSCAGLAYTTRARAETGLGIHKFNYISPYQSFANQRAGLRGYQIRPEEWHAVRQGRRRLLTVAG
jgi:hypothetical protein